MKVKLFFVLINFYGTLWYVVDLWNALPCGLQEFEDARDADDAVYDLNGKVLCGER